MSDVSCSLDKINDDIINSVADNSENLDYQKI
jgi:hypothetical protein